MQLVRLLLGAFLLLALTAGSVALSNVGVPRQHVTVSLTLSSGASEKDELFDQPYDPRTHTADVVMTFPIEAEIEVSLYTTDLGHLRLVDRDHTSGCVAAGRFKRCDVRLPILEARLPGVWRLSAVKTSGPAARLSVDFAFHKPNGT